MILPKKTTYINGTKMDYLPSGNIEITTDELLTLDAKLGVKLNEGILECVNSSPTLPDQEPYFKNVINIRDIKNDCELLKTMQDSFPNVSFILTTDCVPFFNIYKDIDEAFSFHLKYYDVQITADEYKEYVDFNLDEKFACFLSDLYHILVEKDCINKKCVVVYGGSSCSEDTRLSLENFTIMYTIKHRLNILEIKL